MGNFLTNVSQEIMNTSTNNENYLHNYILNDQLIKLKHVLSMSVFYDKQSQENNDIFNKLLRTFNTQSIFHHRKPFLSYVLIESYKETYLIFIARDNILNRRLLLNISKCINIENLNTLETIEYNDFGKSYLFEFICLNFQILHNTILYNDCKKYKHDLLCAYMTRPKDFIILLYIIVKKKYITCTIHQTLLYNIDFWLKFIRKFCTNINNIPELVIKEEKEIYLKFEKDLMSASVIF